MHNWFCSKVVQNQPKGGFCTMLGQKLSESYAFYFCPTTKELNQPIAFMILDGSYFSSLAALVSPR